MPTPRHTTAQCATLTGTGLHSGRPVSVTLRPGEPGYGLKFRRTDVRDAPLVPVRPDAVRDVDHRTVLGNGSATVSTVEHLLAAIAATEIDDLLIELNGPEPPVFDGSAAEFVATLDRVGIIAHGGEADVRTVTAPCLVREGEATYVISPHNRCRLTVTIDFPHPAIGQQSGCYDITRQTFAEELAPARTFGFLRDAEALRSKGLSRGASEKNTILLSDDGVVGTSLRWPDEFVRHKAVDLLGDLALAGGRVRADIVAFKPSHRGNVAVAEMLVATTPTSTPPVMDIEDILAALPHRYPMLLVDRIVEIEPGKRIVGIKNVTINEPFFQGHFPGHPIMPGVLIIEALAQTGGLLLMRQLDNPQEKVVYFMSIDKAKFRRPVVPGDQLRLELELLQLRGETCRMGGEATVNGQRVAEAEMMARIVDR